MKSIVHYRENCTVCVLRLGLAKMLKKAIPPIELDSRDTFKEEPQ